MCCNFTSRIQERVLERAFKRAEEANPGCPAEDILSNMLKTLVPGTIVGSPA
jgi:hypothetical protein